MTIMPTTTGKHAQIVLRLFQARQTFKSIAHETGHARETISRMFNKGVGSDQLISEVSDCVGFDIRPYLPNSESKIQNSKLESAHA